MEAPRDPARHQPALPDSLSRRVAVLREHRELIARIKAQDADGAAAVVARHVEGSGRHIIEQMRVANPAHLRQTDSQS